MTSRVETAGPYFASRLYLYDPAAQCYVGLHSSSELFDLQRMQWVRGPQVTRPRANACGCTVELPEGTAFALLGGQAVGTGEASGDANLLSSEGHWKALTPMPVKRFDAASASIGGDIFVAGGADGANKEVATLLRLHGGQWSQEEPMHVRRAAFALTSMESAVHGSSLFAVGGFHPHHVRLNSCERFHVRTRRWVRCSGMATARSGHGCIEVAGALFVLGGWNAKDGYLSSVERYDPADDTWSAVTPMPTERTGLCVARIGRQIFALGGALRPARRLCPLPSRRRAGHNTSGALGVAERYDGTAPARRAPPSLG